MDDNQTAIPVPVDRIQRVAVIGAGTIGASWAACFLANGLDVIAVDPVRDEADLRRAIDGMLPALESLGLAPCADSSRLQFSAQIGAELAAAQFVQESVPERLTVKRETLRALESTIDPQVIVSSSSTAMLPSDIQAEARHPQRLIVGHPFNPPHLIPLVEIAGGRQTAPHVLDWAVEFYLAIGKAPVLMKKEAYGHIANRLTAALFREAVHLVAEGITTVEGIDEVVLPRDRACVGRCRDPSPPITWPEVPVASPTTCAIWGQPRKRAGAPWGNRNSPRTLSRR